MTSLPFDYLRHRHMRTEIIAWAKDNNGTVVRNPPEHGFLGRITSIDFENDEDAVVFKLRFGI